MHDQDLRAYLLQVPHAFAFCHFDQEPIYQHDELSLLYATEMRQSFSWPRLLANSERSRIKSKYCKQLGLIDWYYFFHGFAALDWYRDAQYLDVDHDITHVYLSFNHLVKHKRSYRMALTARLIDKGLLDHGIVSFHGSNQDCADEISDQESNLSPASRKLVERVLSRDSKFPWIVDYENINGSASASFGHKEYQSRQRAFLSLVNETVFFDDKLHLTEKIFQPIVCKRPFVLAAAPGNLAYLRSYGFSTFGNWIDESYDLETDSDRRMDLITAELVKLCDRPMHELKQMLEDMRPVLEHNKQHFFGEFKRMIVDELVENFNQAIRVWNNGRVDARIHPLHPNPHSVKQILLR